MNQDLPDPDPAAALARSSPPSAPDSAQAGPFVCDAAEWGVLDVAGADAATFLQGQLTNDVARLAPLDGQWTSYNSPKGRMLANGFLWRGPMDDSYHFALSADVAEPVRKRLSMFVLRSKVSLRDATAALVRIGVTGEGAAKATLAAVGAMPAAGRVADHDGTTVIHLPDGRFLILAPLARATALRARLLDHASTGDAQAWRRAGIRSGVALVTLATQDAFVPQTANWEVIGGVRFDKGCYTGQEIVARTQHLGRLKERLGRFRVDAEAPAAGARLFSPAFGDQACGTIVNAAILPGGGCEILAVAQTAALEVDDLHLDALAGPRLTSLPLPYAIPQPAPPRGRIA